MKKLFALLVLSAVFLALPGTIRAQQVTVKANIFSPIVKTGSFFAEYAFSPTKSAQLGFFSTGIKIKDTKFSGYGITPEVRHFFFGNAPSGLYGAGYLRFQHFTLTEEEKNLQGTMNSVGAGVLLGYQLMLGKHVVLDTFLGPGFNSVNVDGGTKASDFDLGTFGGFSPRGGISIGLAF